MPAADLVEAGVDPTTATTEGIIGGLFTAAMIAAPASGKTLKETLALIAANPVFGAAREGIQKKTLEAVGYEKQAEMFNPYDPENRAIDLVMGAVFGGLAHYGRARQAMPKHFEDSLDVAGLAQKTAKSNPLEGAKNVSTHIDAHDKAMSDVMAGRPVDVMPVLKDVPLEAIKPPVPDAETVKMREIADAEIKAAEADIKAGMDKPMSSAEEPLTGDFGPIYTEFKNDARGAVRRLMGAKTGEAVAALHHKDVGEIDLVWGKEGTPEKDYKDGYGLAKIAKKYPDVVDENLQDILSPMVIRSKSANRISLESPDRGAGIKLSWERKEKRWVVTAFKKKEPSAEGMTGVSGDKGEAKASEKPATIPEPVEQADISPVPKPSVSAGVEGKEGLKPILSDPVEATGERILTDNPGMTLHVGTDEAGGQVVKTAREVVDEARAEAQKVGTMKDLFDLAVDCLRKG